MLKSENIEKFSFWNSDPNIFDLVSSQRFSFYPAKSLSTQEKTKMRKKSTQNLNYLFPAG